LRSTCDSILGMRTLKFSLALSLLAATALAQTPPPDKIVATNSEIMAMVAKAKADRKPDQPTFAQPLLALAPYGANLEYRAAVGPSAVHKKYAEFFYVVDGSATLVTGGKLANEKANGDNLSGTGIEGGSPRQVAKGDFVIVPENTPHWFSAINGNITLMSFRLPRP
jgi:mannose-6-phosphate isomerase-like protein (cupin superfamily)